MATLDLVKALMRAGVEFATDGETVRWRNSGGRMTPEAVDALKAAKAEVIDFLTRRGASHDDAPRSRLDDDPFRHGRSVAGRPLTWTGRVVSLDEWRRLPEWDRHGPEGARFNSSTRNRKTPEGE